MAIRVVIADDHVLFRSGLKHALVGESALEVVGEAGDGLAAITACEELSPHVVLMDVTMPLCCGVEATQRIADRFPDIKVIGLSMHDNHQACVDMLAAGARGYVVKTDNMADLLMAISMATDSGCFVSSRIRKPHHLPEPENDQARQSVSLSPREREVVRLIAAGRATKEVAADLDISIKTVETHRRQIMVKLHRHSIAELTKYAIREGLTGL